MFEEFGVFERSRETKASSSYGFSFIAPQSMLREWLISPNHSIVGNICMAEIPTASSAARQKHASLRTMAGRLQVPVSACQQKKPKPTRVVCAAVSGCPARTGRPKPNAAAVAASQDG